MNDASKLLFDTLYDDKPLFTNQLDLVNALICASESFYYVNEKEFEKVQKEQTRLKTYISQLLSSTVARNITEDFKRSLIVVIKKRLINLKVDPTAIVEEIINELKKKNVSGPKNEIKNSTADHFFDDLKIANYIAVITSKPLEIDVPVKTAQFSLRKFLFEDLIDRLNDPSKDLKFYRFNFPLPASGLLFWRGLKRILFNHIKSNLSKSLFDSLYQKFAIGNDTFITIDPSLKPTDEQVNLIVNEILTQLNRNRYIMIFISTAPIYGIPLVILDPSEVKNIRVYAMLEMDPEKINIFKFPDNETILWRVFVWDQLKAKESAGEELKYSKDL